MAAFRLVHISDLHFSDRPNSLNPFVGGLRWSDFALLRNFAFFSPSSFSSALATHLTLYLESVQQGIDALVVTGDVATTGSQGNLKFAREYFFGKPVRTPEPIYEALRFSSRRDSSLPVLVMPGNHDRFEGTRCLPGGAQFEAVFGDSWDADQDVVQYNTKRVKMVVLGKDGEHLGICLADFSLRRLGDHVGKLGWFGQGKVYDDILHDLETLTVSAKREIKNLYVIWAIHFPPVHPVEEVQLQLIDGRLIGPKAEACGVGVIICGHVHEARIYRIPTSPKLSVICAGSATSVEQAAEHALFEMELNLSKGALVAGAATKISYDSVIDEFRTVSSTQIQ